MSLTSDKAGYGVFRAGDRLIGVPIGNLAEVCLVPSLSKLMTGEGAVVGAFDLRGHLIPLIDGNALEGAASSVSPSSMAAVIQSGDRVAAIGLDEIIDLTEARPTDTDFGRVSTAADKRGGDERAGGRAFRQGFVLNGDIVNCLDAEVFFASDNVMSVQQKRAGDRQDTDTDERKYLIFCVGGVHFGVDTAEVWATVPRHRLDTSGVRVEDGICLGFADHFGWRVPVLATNRVFGLGRQSDTTETEVVVLRFPNDRLLGLQVDAMERLSTLPKSGVQNSGPLIARQGLLPKVYVAEDETQIFLIDYASLSSQETLLSFSEFSAETSSIARAREEGRGQRDGAFREKERYLVFEAGHRRAVPAASVSRILRMPDRIVPAPDMPSAVLGFFTVGSHSVPLVMLDQAAASKCGDGFVLLVGPPGQQVGFCAERISAIRSSEWRIPTEEEGGVDLIQIGTGTDAFFLPVADLETAASTLLED